MFEDKKNKIKTFWDEKAKQYGSDPIATTGDRLLRDLEIDNILKYIPNEINLKIADFGCGNGFSTIEYAKSRSAHFFGYDYSKNMVEEAKKRCKEESLIGNVEFEYADILNLSFLPSNFLDIATTDRCIINLVSIDDQKKAITEIYNVLKPNGYFIMCEGSQQGLSKINELRKSVGLSVIENHWHNLYIDENEILPFLNGLFEIVEINNFCSLYYIASRIFNAVSSQNPEKPDYFSIINKTAVKIPSVGDYSPFKIYYLKKK